MTRPGAAASTASIIDVFGGAGFVGNFFEPRTINDVDPPNGLKPLSSYRLANDYLKFVTNEKQLVVLRKRFEKYSGPITNVGGVK